MDAPINTDLRRKWFILSVLGLAGFAALGLAGEVGLQESNLPSDVKFDELRLLEPQRFDDAAMAELNTSFETTETRLSVLNRCLKVKFSGGGSNCIKILESLLRDNPANGRLWLEMARMRSRDGEGLNDDALNALQHSYEYAPREGWITRVRTSFVLSVWEGLTPDLQKIAAADMLEALQDYNFIVYLSDIYQTNPITRFAISEVIAKAPIEIQHKFIAQLRRSLDN